MRRDFKSRTTLIHSNEPIGKTNRSRFGHRYSFYLFLFFCSERCKCVLHKNTEYFSLSMNRGGLIRTLCINYSAGVFIFIHLSKDALLCILTQEGRSPLLLNDLDDMYSCSSLSNCIADLSLASFASRECFHPA